jgi:plasmid stabilization system protein ParE
MKKYRVILTAGVLAQLEELQIYIEDKAGYGIAASYVSRIHEYCESFSTFPRRGASRDDLMPGLRIVNYKKRTTIALVIEGNDVVIIGVYYGGQDIDSRLANMDI